MTDEECGGRTIAQVFMALDHGPLPTGSLWCSVRLN